MTDKATDERSRIQDAADNARKVFKDSCNHTHDAIEYMKEMLFAGLASAAPAQKAREPWQVMMSAHALCPTEMSHPARMRWMADYFLKEIGLAQPPQHGEGLTDVEIDFIWNSLPGIQIHNDAASKGLDTAVMLRRAFARRVVLAAKALKDKA